LAAAIFVGDRTMASPSLAGAAAVVTEPSAYFHPIVDRRLSWPKMDTNLNTRWACVASLMSAMPLTRPNYGTDQLTCIFSLTIPIDGARKSIQTRIMFSTNHDSEHEMYV